MNEASSNLLEMRASALREMLRGEQERRSREALQSAERQAHEIVRAARHAARERMRETIRRERAHLAEALAKARAARETQQRQAHMALLRTELVAALDALPQHLEQRWQQPQERVRWCTTALELAARHLEPGAWTIDCAPGITSEEIAALIVARSDSPRPRVQVQTNADLRAGLRIAAEGACLDATISGLTRDRERTEALLVAALERESSRT